MKYFMFSSKYKHNMNNVYLYLCHQVWYAFVTFEAVFCYNAHGGKKYNIQK